MSDASSSNRHVLSSLGSTNPPTSITLVLGAGIGSGAGAGSGTGAGAGAGAGAGSGTGVDADVSLVSDWTPDVSGVPDSDGGASDGGVNVTPVTSVSLVADVAAIGSLIKRVLSRLSFPVLRSGVKSDFTRPQEMSNTVVAVNRHLLALYSSPIFTLFLGFDLALLTQ